MRLVTQATFALIAVSIAANTSYAFGKKRSEPSAPENTIDFSIGDITVGGEGCPQGTVVDVERTGNEMVLHVRSTDFNLELNSAESGSGFIRKGCSLAIPVARLAENSQLRVLSVSFQGKYDIRALADAKIRAETFVVGEGPNQSRVVDVPLTDGTQDAAGELRVIATDLTKTCKTEPQILRLNSSAIIKNKENSPPASRSQLAINDIVLKLRAEPCEN